MNKLFETVISLLIIIIIIILCFFIFYSTDKDDKDDKDNNENFFFFFRPEPNYEKNKDIEEIEVDKKKPEEMITVDNKIFSNSNYIYFNDKTKKKSFNIGIEPQSIYSQGGVKDVV